MQNLHADYQRSAIRVPKPLLTGLDAKLHSFAGTFFKGGHNVVMSLIQQAEKIDAESRALRELPEHRLHQKLLTYREAFRRQKRGYEELLPEALGAVQEAADRRLGMRPYVVQLAGALALYKGYVAEMATGEGKTLTAALAATLRGWIGRPCHIVTVNDYLAARDAKWMEPLYRLCNVTVGHVIGEMDTDARRDGHHNDVVYTTGKEIVADFLRDRLWLGRLQKAPRRQIAWLLGRQRDVDRGLVTRGIHSAIVDEADSVLIDEAVTPLIISKAAPNDSFVEACNLASRIAGELSAGKDYTVDDRYRDVELKSHVHDIVSSQVAAFDGSFRSVRGYMDLVHQAVIAREFFHRDDQYVVQDDQVVIVDEFTGRQMPQRKWRAGLHQFVEAKEGIDMTTPTETLARLSFQRFYRFFHVLAGMTGTARESAGELWDIYELPTLSIPENKPCQRVVRRPQAFADAESKWQAIVAEVAAMHDQGRPVLVGTRSVQASETLSRRLDEVGITHQLLNAVRHAEEAVIVSGAGDRGAVTIATNMAGRGTDIKLARGVAALGGLHVIASEGHESKRIDRQLFGRCARQGDPGSARLFISMEDELIRRYVAAPIRTSISAQLGRGVPGAGSAAMAALGWAQQTAQRIAYQRRRSVLRMDTWLEDSLSFAYREVS